MLLSIYFLSDSKDSKKEDVKESNSNIVSETATHEEESNIVSNQNAAPVSNQNTTPVSNVVNNKASNKSLAKSIPVKSISISGAKTVVAGSKITLKATINPSNASNKKATYKITVTAKTVQISKISIDSFYQGMEIPVGYVFNMKEVLNISPSNASYSGLKYSSTNTKVATVSSDGTVKPIAIGNTTITVVAPNGSKATLKFSVINSHPTTFYIYGSKEEMTVNDLIIKVISVSDGECSINQTCKGIITLVVNIGKSGNLKQYTLKTDGSKVNITGTDYKASADIVDGRIVINIYGMAL